ncbi:MAG: TonB-dependent receptor [Pirellulales bacterium]
MNYSKRLVGGRGKGIFESKSIAIAVSAAVSMLALNTAVKAQDEPAIEEVVVTGSLIQRADYVSASPVVTIGKEVLEDFGVVTLDQIMDTLPQSLGSYSARSNNPANAGIASVNLRGLGPNRTLVLIDGTRAMPSDGTNLVDLSLIPSSLVNRVEVISGGASATYGSAALAGVVNVSLDSKFEGFDISAQFSTTAEDDGEESVLELVWGQRLNDDKAGIVLFGSYVDREPVSALDRRNTAWPINRFRDDSGEVVDQFRPGFLEEGRAQIFGNPPSQAAVDEVFGAYGVAPGLDICAGQNCSVGVNQDGSLFSLSPLENFRDSPPSVLTDPYGGNFDDPGLLQIPLERWSVGALGDFEVNDRVKLYGRLIYSHREVERLIGPASVGGRGSLALLPAPLNAVPIPADLATLMASRPDPSAPIFVERVFTELGGRGAIFEDDHYQALGGIRMKIGDAWNLNAHLSYGELDRKETQPGTLNSQALTQLMSGEASCGEGFALFGRNSISDACVDFISYLPEFNTTFDQTVVEAVASGPIYTLPAGDVLLAFGASYRDNGLAYRGDAFVNAGNTVGFRAQDFNDGSIDVSEFFGELVVPLLADKPGAELLEASFGYRVSDYSTAGNVESYKGELNYLPVDSVRLRASFQRANRAPNLTEVLFTQGDANENIAEDPCSAGSSFRTGNVAGVDPARVTDLCVAQGIPTGAIGEFQGSTSLQGTFEGNPNLDVETADTFTAGIVWTPRDDLSISLDYYEIEVEDFINFSAFAPLLERCYNAFGANPNYSANSNFCGSFGRDSQIGNIVDIKRSFENVATVERTGLDFQLNYDLSLEDAGTLSVNALVSTLMEANEQQFIGDPVVDYAGSIGGRIFQTLPEYQSTVTLSWSRGALAANLRWRHIDSMENRRVIDNSADTSSVGVPSMDYLDFTG